ncbi:MAG: hypothetical protein ACREMY_12995 [bacterium]
MFLGGAMIVLPGCDNKEGTSFGSSSPLNGVWYANGDSQVGCVTQFTDDTFVEFCPNWAGKIAQRVQYRSVGNTLQVLVGGNATIFTFVVVDRDTISTDSNTEIAHIAGPYSMKRCQVQAMDSCSRERTEAAERAQALSERQEEARRRAEEQEEAKAQAEAESKQEALLQEQQKAREDEQKSRNDAVRQACQKGEELRVRGTVFLEAGKYAWPPYLFSGQLVEPIPEENTNPSTMDCGVQFTRGQRTESKRIAISDLELPQ